MTANMRTFRVATACLFAATGLTPALAQDYDVNSGIVRISDSKAPAVQSASTGEYHAGPGVYGDYGYVDGDCPHCYGGKGNGGKFKEKYCTHSPDHGYSVPGKWPIQRYGVQYQHLFPYAWYSVYTGQPYVVAAPQIYQPTDTTQLGYYGQHVPFWQPNPAMLPARPVPAQWHHYAPVVYASQHGRLYTKGGGVIEGGAMDGGYVNGSVIYHSPTPVGAPAPAELQPVPEKTAPADIPPKPLMESAVPLPLERVNFQN